MITELQKAISYVNKRMAVVNEELANKADVGETAGIASDGSITTIIKLTQAEYDALGSYDTTTLYVIVG
jgi:hypothetical protein